MPLAEVGGSIAVFLKHFGDSRFAFQQMHLVKPFGDDGIDSGAIVMAARKEGSARRGTRRRSRVEISEAHPTGGQLVENGSLNWSPVTAEITVAEIVDKQSNDVRAFVLGKTGTKQQQEAQKCEDGFHG